MVAKEYSLRQLGITQNQISQASLETVKTLVRNGHESYLVGGAVRDLLLGLSPKDYDVATDARPDQVKRLFRRAFIIGRRFRLVHVHIHGETVEVSTFRKKPAKTQRGQNGNLKSDNVYGSPAQDANRRDMTINALMLDPIKKRVIDHTNGMADIKKRKLRIIGNPAERYREDPVRMMRLLRLAAKLNCDIEPSSLRPIHGLAHTLADMPYARLFDEYTKVVFSGTASKAFAMFLEHGIAGELFPHLADYDDRQIAFVMEALHATDHITRKNDHASLSVVVSSLFWPGISKKWVQACAENKANMNLMRELFAESKIERSRIPRALQAKVWKIWEYQSRFHNLRGKRKALRIDHRDYSVRKAFAFLRLRNEAGEIGPELPDWWDGFFAMDDKEKSLQVSGGTRKRRQRRGKRIANGDTGP